MGGEGLKELSDSQKLILLFTDERQVEFTPSHRWSGFKSNSQIPSLKPGWPFYSPFIPVGSHSHAPFCDIPHPLLSPSPDPPAHRILWLPDSVLSIWLGRCTSIFIFYLSIYKIFNILIFLLFNFHSNLKLKNLFLNSLVGNKKAAIFPAFLCILQKTCLVLAPLIFMRIMPVFLQQREVVMKWSLHVLKGGYRNQLFDKGGWSLQQNQRGKSCWGLWHLASHEC